MFLLPRYFAYGSNMNPARMRARQCGFVSARPARLQHFELRFNKRAHGKQGVGYANVNWCPGAVIEGVVYTLTDITQLQILDPFEGTPVRYSRDLLQVETDDGPEAAWVYVANPAWVDESVLPEERYLKHLLSDAAPLSATYRAALAAHPAIPATEPYCETRALRLND